MLIRMRTTILDLPEYLMETRSEAKFPLVTMTRMLAESVRNAHTPHISVYIHNLYVREKDATFCNNAQALSAHRKCPLTRSKSRVLLWKTHVKVCKRFTRWMSAKLVEHNSQRSTVLNGMLSANLELHKFYTNWCNNAECHVRIVENGEFSVFCSDHWNLETKSKLATLLTTKAHAQDT